MRKLFLLQTVVMVLLVLIGRPKFFQYDGPYGGKIVVATGSRHNWYFATHKCMQIEPWGLPIVVFDVGSNGEWIQVLSYRTKVYPDAIVLDRTDGLSFQLGK